MADNERGLHVVTDDLRAPWRQDGLPVVFHHGIGTNAAIWSDWLPVIAPHHAVTRFDMRGWGRSPVPDESHRWTMDEFIADLMSVVEMTGAPKVHVVGESMGGTVALAAACAQPARFASINISNATHRGQGIGQIAGWRSQFEAEGVGAWGQRMMEHRFGELPEKTPALDWFEAEQARARAHVTLAAAEVLAAADLTEALKSFDVPLSIVLPDGSPFVPVEHGVEMLRLAPRARLRIVPATGHGLPFSHARSEAEHLIHFLREVESGRA